MAIKAVFPKYLQTCADESTYRALQSEKDAPITLHEPLNVKCLRDYPPLWSCEAVTPLKKVLVVDDEAGPRLAVGWILRLGKIAHPVACANADEALRIVSSDPDIRVGIIDLHMTGMSGIELVKRIRAINPDFRAISTRPSLR